ncbi:GNAT family N-acetyltransferase [Tissierella sp.]|uniref:GNAT family N-acetyltransferase n=1 Tax=Tissierella sp. TaxID=41274 RepID=UPI00285848F9|nr:GNAT family N-acetyltransferase [Tissierella sp.]MDR7857028.1 GNAT family N-acetyltransferase [Tissierella sp.]
MYTGKITIKETTVEDLDNIMNLWNNGEVMFYVGFPKGLGITMDKLEKWLSGVNQNQYRKHYSIYADGIGYCGETYYEIDCINNLSALDIKLLPHAQGKGIAEFSLRFAITQVFENKLATRAYVDPNPDNKSAWKLYHKLGFVSKSRPEFLEPYSVYLEITEDEYKKWDKVAEN